MKSIKTVLVLLFLLFLVSSLTKNIIDYQKKLQFYEDYKSEYESEKKRNITLKTEVLKNSDLNEIEKTLRNKLNLLKPNEIAIIVPTPTPTVSTLTPIPLPPWQQRKELFLKR